MLATANIAPVMDEVQREQDHRRAVLTEWVATRGGHAEVVRQRKLNPSQASYLSQLMNGYSFGSRAARNMEARLGMPERYLEPANPQREGVARNMISTAAMMVAPVVSWETIVAGEALPEEFKASLPDDAMAPEFPRGLELVWSPSRPAAIGSIVIVQDRHGQHHVRQYAQGRSPDRWSAQATGRGYASFDSEEDGLRLIAVAKYRPMP